MVCWEYDIGRKIGNLVVFILDLQQEWERYSGFVLSEKGEKLYLDRENCLSVVWEGQLFYDTLYDGYRLP